MSTPMSESDSLDLLMKALYDSRSERGERGPAVAALVDGASRGDYWAAKRLRQLIEGTEKYADPAQDMSGPLEQARKVEGAGP